jgi:hypothetical protein
MPFDGVNRLCDTQSQRGIKGFLGKLLGLTGNPPAGRRLTALEKLDIMEAILEKQTSRQQLSYNTCLWHGMQQNADLLNNGLYRSSIPNLNSTGMDGLQRFLPFTFADWLTLVSQLSVENKRAIIWKKRSELLNETR